MPNLIHLKDYSDVYEDKICTLKFIKAEATQSRLMGVIGIRIAFSELVLYFHLDFEEYGFDRFEVTDKLDENMTASIMGGLGEGLVDISLQEASNLIYDAIDVGERFGYSIPLDFFTYEYLLGDRVEEVSLDLYKKICVKMTSDEMTINYYLMRTAGLDHHCKKLVLQDGDFDFEFIDEPTVLLKNEILPYEGDYICRAIIDYFDAYKMLVTRIKVDSGRVMSCNLVEDLILSPKEAAFQLNKKEYILLYYMTSHKEFLMSFPQASMMKNKYDSGVLLTAFNRSNDHVKGAVYYLNGDVHASYYVTDNQLVVTCFEQESINEIKDGLEAYDVTLQAELEADNPLLNRFITSGHTDFFEFLGE